MCQGQVWSWVAELELYIGSDILIVIIMMRGQH